MANVPDPIAADDQQLRAKLKNATRRIERLERLRHDVLSRLSHELKTPLTTIMGFAEVLLEPEQFEAEEIREFAREIYDKARHLNLISEDMVNLARMEAGMMGYELRPTDPLPLIRRVAGEYREEIRLRGTELELALAPVGPVRADTEKLGQVLRHLLRNAMEATTESDRITISTTDDGTEVQIQVRDTGKGIPPEEIEFIFEKFVQVEDILHHSDGMGLGLSLSRRIIEDGHKGRITASSDGPGHGARLTIHLPR